MSYLTAKCWGFCAVYKYTYICHNYIYPGSRNYMCTQNVCVYKLRVIDSILHGVRRSRTSELATSAPGYTGERLRRREAGDGSVKR